ncbi:MAG TPA: diadenylate cyclase CdaA [Candidatus Nanopelagicales bacterium]|nr:diadenylate cyclase CdaA [Candidatus Nanopelagicales bacterium]
MIEGLLRLFSARPPLQILRDLFDIFIVAFIVYRALLVLRGTRAMQMGLGLGIVFLVYLGAKLFRLTTLLNLLSWLLSSIILIVVVVFQNDIRRALIRVGGKAWFSAGREQQSRVIDEVVAAATELARHRMGAIIAFEQDANVLEFVKSEGIHIDSMVTRELLVSLFVPESVNKLHDGAVLIRDLKIARAGVFFPMPETKILDASLGSRHRAALGITEETDAVVVVVSEERGTISFCFSGNIVSNLDGQSLRHALLGLFGRSSRKRRFARRPTRPALTASGPPSMPAPRPPTEPSKTAAATPRPGGMADKTPPPKPPPAPAPAPAAKLPTSTPMKPAEMRASLPNDADRPSPDRGRTTLGGEPPQGKPTEPRGDARGTLMPEGGTDNEGRPAVSQRTFVPTGTTGGAEGSPPRDDS